MMYMDITNFSILLQQEGSRKGIKWKPPKQGSVNLNMDGSYTSNGDICSGGLIQD